MIRSYKRSLVIIGVILTINTSIQSQVIYFDSLYDNALNISNAGYNVITKDGKYIIGGNGFQSCSTSTIDLFSVDSIGNLEWVKTYSGSLLQNSKLIETSDSSYIFLNTNSQMCFTPISYGITLLKINTNGDSLWNKSISSGISSDIKVIKNNEFIIAGSNLSCFVICSSDFMLIKLDSLGNILWDTTYGDMNKLEYISSVELLGDGGFLLFGTIEDSMGSNKDVYIVKVDSIGNFKWDKRIVSTASTTITGSLQSNDGNYIIYGYKDDGGINKWQEYIAKLDTSGTILWEKSYGGTNSEKINKLIELPDENLIGVGGAWISGSSYGILTKFNSVGDSLWAKTFTINDTIYSYFNDIQLTNDNGFIIAGSKNGDMWLVKVDSMGCLYAGCDTVTFIDKEIVSNSQLSIYPNPFSTYITIKINPLLVTESKMLIFEVYDILGKKVKRIENIKTNTIELNRNDLPAGLYIYHLINENGTNEIGKIIAE